MPRQMRSAQFRVLALSVLLAPIVVSGQAANPNPTSAPLGPDAPFTVAMNTATIEGAPVYVAANGPRAAGVKVINGGVRNLANNSAHAATNAETQMLIAAGPKVRLLFTVSEGLYRVVAKRSAGIATVSDLRGKRITVPRDTSAHYFLVRTLASVGLSESDVTLVDLPRDRMAAGVVAGNADAISMWEPEAQKAVEALGRDAIVFQNNALYRELFSLYTTTDILNDARRRRQLVEFVRALLMATEELKTRPQAHFPLIASTVGQNVDLVSRSWEHHGFPAAVPGDLLDVMVQEETWIARNQRRVPRTRAALAEFVDTTVIAEALSGARTRR
jgi:sulfonate transport system substrate-binding protein